jgi:hypothetical protein
MRARLVLAAGTAALALAGSVLAAAPAMAAPCTPPVGGACGDTAVTFTLTAGALAISAPATAGLGSVNTSSAATSITGQLGSTTVTDGRAALVAAYAVTLSASNFTTGTSGPTETIVGSTVTAFSGAVTHTNTTASKVATATSTGVPTATPIMGLAAYSGTDTAVYNPTISVPIPATNVAGLYSGVVTQTVTAV